MYALLRVENEEGAHRLLINPRGERKRERGKQDPREKAKMRMFFLLLPHDITYQTRKRGEDR